MKIDVIEGLLIYFNASFPHIPDGPRDGWGKGGPAESGGEGDTTASNCSVPRIVEGGETNLDLAAPC